jgi:hypothetical protein
MERRHLLEAVNEATIGSRNELVHIQWQHSMVQHPTACMQCDGGHFKHVLR